MKWLKQDVRQRWRIRFCVPREGINHSQSQQSRLKTTMERKNKLMKGAWEKIHNKLFAENLSDELRKLTEDKQRDVHGLFGSKGCAWGAKLCG